MEVLDVPKQILHAFLIDWWSNTMDVLVAVYVYQRLQRSRGREQLGKLELNGQLENVTYKSPKKSDAPILSLGWKHPGDPAVQLSC